MRRFLAALLLVPALALADEGVKTLKPGDALPVFKLNDQHDKPIALGPDTRTILFTADKTAGDMLNGLLKERPADFMPQRKLVYIADISRMPGLITSMIALPRMREYPYRMAVASEEGQTAMLPRAEDSVTVIHLENGKVKELLMFKETEVQPLAALLDSLPVVTDSAAPSGSERKGSRLVPHSVSDIVGGSR